MAGKPHAMHFRILSLFIYTAVFASCTSTVTGDKYHYIYKPGTSLEEQQRDYRTCGIRGAPSRPTYPDQNFSKVMTCMRARGYDVRPSPKFEFVPTSPKSDAEQDGDFVSCGGVIAPSTGIGEVQESTLPRVEGCMRRKGYRVRPL